MVMNLLDMSVLRAEVCSFFEGFRSDVVKDLEEGLAGEGYCLHGHKDVAGGLYCATCGAEVFLRPDFRLDTGGPREVSGILGGAVLLYALSPLLGNNILVMSFEVLGAVMLYTGFAMCMSASWGLMVAGGVGALWSTFIADRSGYLVAGVYSLIFVVGLWWRIFRLSKVEKKKRVEFYIRVVDYVLDLLKR